MKTKIQKGPRGENIWEILLLPEEIARLQHLQENATFTVVMDQKTSCLKIYRKKKDITP